LEECKKIYHDIHGVADKVAEEPKFVARKLNELREVLIQLKSS
jgi:hypothetical protein